MTKENCNNCTNKTHTLTKVISEWIVQLMKQKTAFTTYDLMQIIPLKKYGINLNNLTFGNKDFDYIFSLIEDMLPIFANKYSYVHNNGSGEWLYYQDHISPSNNNVHTYWEETEIDEGNSLEEDTTNNSTFDVKNYYMVDPFENYVKSMRALLGADPDVTVLSDVENKVINICVAGCTKPDAYRKFFPGNQNINYIGNVKILVNGHDKTFQTKVNLTTLKEMLYNHPLVKEIKVTYTPNKHINRIFVIFKNQTIQFKNDNFGSPYNVTTLVPEDVARKVMNGSNMTILWTTDSELAPDEISPDKI